MAHELRAGGTTADVKPTHAVPSQNQQTGSGCVGQFAHPPNNIVAWCALSYAMAAPSLAEGLVPGFFCTHASCADAGDAKAAKAKARIELANGSGARSLETVETREGERGLVMVRGPG